MNSPEPVSFDVSKEDHKKIVLVMNRLAKYETANRVFPVDRLSLSMDLSACIAQGCPLDLDVLLGFDDFNFLHDVYGIIRHIDRETGKLTGYFLPRAARPRYQAAAKGDAA